MSPKQATLRWRKSTRSAGNSGECVEVAHTLGAVRDSKNPTGPVLNVPVQGLLIAVSSNRLS